MPRHAIDHRREQETLDYLAKLERRANGSGVRASAGTSRGGWLGGTLDRGTDVWQPAQMTHPQMFRLHGSRLRSRARDLYENNEHAGGAIDTIVNNVVRTGIRPKPTGDNYDEDTASQVQRHFEWWAGAKSKEADCEGEITFYALMALWLTEIITAGGCLTHYVIEPSSRNLSRTLPLSINLIPEERFADDKDDYMVWHSARKSNANRFINGVEIDSRGRRVNYWIMPDDLSASQPESLPASACQYTYIRGRIGQYRGVTLLKRAIMTLWRLGFYTDNEMLGSNLKSCFAAVISTDLEEEADEGLLDGDSTLTDQHGNLLEKLQGGIVARLKPGDSITGVSPNVPGSDSMAWINFIERSIAIGLNQSAVAVSKDFAKLPFSAARAALNGDQQVYQVLQQFTVDYYCEPTWCRFMGHASRRGLQGIPSPAELAADLPGWTMCKWKTPGWKSVNPYDDARAMAVRFNYDQIDPEQLAADSGDDASEILESLDRWEGRRQSLPNLANRAADKSRNSTGIRRKTAGTDDADDALDDPEAGRETTNSTKDSK